MRLLQCSGSDGRCHLTPDLSSHDIPPYAVLSHTWGEPHEEVTFEDMQAGTGQDKLGYEKIKFCASQAAKEGLEHFWVDTCCINKANAVEVQEAITSVFDWYHRSEKCYVYLFDVTTKMEKKRWTWEQDFRGCKWFHRRWTLLELLAPETVEFYSRDGKFLESKRELENLIYEITDIDVDALRGAPMSDFSIETRLRWAKFRHTTAPEDEAYSMVGILGVALPVIYGEGRENALNRLHSEVDRSRRKTSLAFSPIFVVTEGSMPVVEHEEIWLASPSRSASTWYERPKVRIRQVYMLVHSLLTFVGCVLLIAFRHRFRRLKVEYSSTSVKLWSSDMGNQEKESGNSEGMSRTASTH